MYANIKTNNRGYHGSAPHKSRHFGKKPVARNILAQPMPTTSLTVQRQCACGGSCPACKDKSEAQAKNTAIQLSQPTDRHEIEADRIADNVMQMRDTSSGPKPVSNIDEEEDQTVAAGPVMNGAAASGLAKVQIPQSRSHLVPGQGRPLDSGTRNFMEPRFGSNFGDVRIHTDEKANASADSIGARAYTLGNNIVFAKNAYSDSSAGRHLLAHELTHVMQQRDSRVSRRSVVQRLGATPGCTVAQRNTIHGAIRNARGWLNKAIAELDAPALSDKAKSALRRNFGPAQGSPANAPLILGRLRAGYNEVSTIPFSCNSTDPICVGGSCGFATAGSHAGTMCNQSTLAPGTHWIFQAGCVLHEAFHARYSNFTQDFYSGWHGHSSRTAGYPGAGIVPLLNADSYTTLAMDLS
jgi:hypothetical protein